MDNRITEIRNQIRKLRTNMLRAEAVMRDQIKHDEDCTIVAEELLHMRTVMRELVQERATLGDREPVIVIAVDAKAAGVIGAAPGRVVRPRPSRQDLRSMIGPLRRSRPCAGCWRSATSS